MPCPDRRYSTGQDRGSAASCRQSPTGCNSAASNSCPICPRPNDGQTVAPNQPLEHEGRSAVECPPNKGSVTRRCPSPVGHETRSRVSLSQGVFPTFPPKSCPK